MLIDEIALCLLSFTFFAGKEASFSLKSKKDQE
jgi:hypothetical protein